LVEILARVNFVGLVVEYMPYYGAEFSDQAGHVRVIFEENTGLSRVWSVSFLNEIINSTIYHTTGQYNAKTITSNLSLDFSRVHPLSTNLTGQEFSSTFCHKISVAIVWFNNPFVF
jgi:hypothetical protein